MLRRYARLLRPRPASKPRFEVLEDRLAPAIDLSVTSLVSDANPIQGNTVTYTVNVVNNGPDAATGVSVRDKVSDVFGMPAAVSNGGAIPAGTNDIEWSGLSIPSGASLQLTYDVAVGTNNTFIAPSVAFGAQAWNRPLSASAVATYQGWETFASSVGPNAPQTQPGPAFGGNAGDSWQTINARGTANAFDSSAPGNGSFTTSTGNIYSPTSIVTPRIVVPNNMDGAFGSNPNGWTTILLQIRAGGEVIDHNSVVLNGSIKPIDRALLASAEVPGLGLRQTWAFEFQVAGNADSYTLDFAGAGSSVSYDRFAVDTIWKPDAANQAAAYVLSLPAVFTNFSQVTAANQPDSDSTPNNSATVHEDDDASVSVTVGTTPAQLAVTSAVSDSNPVQGNTVTYTVTVRNDGADPATGVTVRDQVPDVFGTPVNICNAGAVPTTTNDVEWTGLTVAPGASLQLTYDVATGTNSTLIAPSTALGSQAWNRPTAASDIATFQGWDVFSSPGGPNAPATQTGPAFGGITGNSWATVNAGGAPNAFDSGAPASGSFLTSSGNIYSPTSVLKPRIVVPNNMDVTPGDNPSGWTTILLQVRSLGAVVDHESVRLGGTVTPVDYALVSSGAGMGVTQTWAFMFQVAGNADVYTLDFAAGGTSLSFDKVSVDTIWKPDATSQAAAYGFPLPLVYKDAVQVTAVGQTATASADVTVGTTLPKIISNGGGTNATLNVVEDSATVTTIAATDPEVPALQTLTYSIIEGGDAALFSIDASTGALRFVTAPDFETPADANGDNVYNVSVNVSDGRGGSDSQTFAIKVGKQSVSEAPQVVSVTPNANLASLAGAQRSRVASMVITFDQPVTLDTGAVTLALHTKNVIYGGVAQAAGYGSLPTSLDLKTTDAKTWIVTFVGNTEVDADGIHSIKDGVYDLAIEGAKVHAAGNPAVKMAGTSTTTFHRLFGDANAATTPAGGIAGTDFEAGLSSADNLAFRGAFNNHAAYKPSFDFNGDGAIGSFDNLQFRNRFNKALAWKV